MDIATGIAARHDDSAMDIATGIAARPHESSRVVPRLSPPRLVTRCRMESGGGSIRTAIQFDVDSKGRCREYDKSTADISLVVKRSGRTSNMKLFVEYDDECCVCVWGNSFKMGVHCDQWSTDGSAVDLSQSGHEVGTDKYYETFCDI